MCNEYIPIKKNLIVKKSIPGVTLLKSKQRRIGEETNLRGRTCKWFYEIHKFYDYSRRHRVTPVTFTAIGFSVQESMSILFGCEGTQCQQLEVFSS